MQLWIASRKFHFVSSIKIIWDIYWHYMQGKVEVVYYGRLIRLRTAKKLFQRGYEVIAYLDENRMPVIRIKLPEI